MGNIRSIIIKDHGHVFQEGSMGNNLLPGSTVGILPNGLIVETLPISSVGGILLESQLQGKGVNDVIPASERGIVWIPQRGDQFWVRADAGKSYAHGEVVSLTHDDFVAAKLVDADETYVLAMVLEDKSVPANPTGDENLIKVQLI